MKIIEPSFKIEWGLENPKQILKQIELAARNCYKSEDKINKESSYPLIRHIIKNGHEAMLEFGDICVRIICDRGISHELVRHRLCSFAQESTRFCNYSKDKFGNKLTFIQPYFWQDTTKGNNNHKQDIWKYSMKQVENYYLKLLCFGASPQEARSILPNSLKTEILIKTNLREWRQIFKLRAVNLKAHSQMRQIMLPILEKFKFRLPVLFEDFDLSLDIFPRKHYAKEIK